MQNEMRKCLDSNEWSIISQIEPSLQNCILCPGQEAKTEEIYSIKDNRGRWLVRSIVDPYPFTHPSVFKGKGNGFLTSFNAHGWSELIVETREHTKELHELTTEEISKVLLIYQKRISELIGKENVEFIGIVKDNLKLEFEHSYSKIFTLPILPKLIREKLNAFSDFMYKNEKCLYCEIVEREKKSPRFVFENESFVAIVPFSQRNIYSTWIIPKAHRQSIVNLTKIELFHLSEMIKNLLKRFSIVLSPFKYSIVFYIKPKNEEDFHFHIEIFQKTINPSIKDGYGINLFRFSPESIAKILRGK